MIKSRLTSGYIFFLAAKNSWIVLSNSSRYTCFGWSVMLLAGKSLGRKVVTVVGSVASFMIAGDFVENVARPARSVHVCHHSAQVVPQWRRRWQVVIVGLDGSRCRHSTFGRSFSRISRTISSARNSMTDSSHRVVCRLVSLAYMTLYKACLNPSWEGNQSVLDTESTACINKTKQKQRWNTPTSSSVLLPFRYIRVITNRLPARP